MKALRHHCDEKWILLLVERWLTAPMHGVEGTHGSRTVGTPQGGPLSPVLANLFLRHALDRWRVRHHPSMPFCRYADDGILHRTSEGEAKRRREHLEARLRDCGLELHPAKTRVVYCKDSKRKGSYENVQFDFLGYTFRPRCAQSRVGKRFTAFSPAMSRSAAKAIRQRVRRWRPSLRSDASLEELASWYSPAIRGWIGDYCRFHRSVFGVIAKHIDAALVRWAMRKYKRLRGQQKRARDWLTATMPALPDSIPALGSCGHEYGWNNGSPVSREVHAGFCEQLRVRFPRLAHPYTCMPPTLTRAKGRRRSGR